MRPVLRDMIGINLLTQANIFHLGRLPDIGTKRKEVGLPKLLRWIAGGDGLFCFYVVILKLTSTLWIVSLSPPT